MLKILSKIIGKKEAKTYLKALEIGNPSISELSKTTNIPRSTTYLILDDLEKLGLISRNTLNDKTQIIPSDPNILTKIINNQISKKKSQQIRLNNIIPQLQKLHLKNIQMPQIKYIEGKANIFNMIFDIFEEVGEKQYLRICQGYSKQDPGLTDEPNYLKKALQKIEETNPIGSEIIPETQSSREYRKKLKNSNIEVLLAPPINTPNKVHIDKYIWLNKLATINYQTYCGIIIEDEFIAKNEKTTFNILRNSLRSNCYKYSPPCQKDA